MKHRISHFKASVVHASLIAIVTSLMLGNPVQAQSDETLRHTIVKGDTLWNLSSRYLEQPWLWPELWEQNTYIENPHLIFPDDVLLISPMSIRLIRNNSLPTNKLSPKIRSKPAHAITTIDPNVIMPFLNQSIIVESEVLAGSAYVLRGLDDKIILGKGSRFYATDLPPSDASEYLLFHSGRAIEDKVTNTTYGIEGVHLGRAIMIKRGDKVAELEVVSANQDIRPGDRLIPIEEPTELPHYFPRRPDSQVDTRIISIPRGIAEVGRRDVVIVSGGQIDGLKAGHVLEVFSYKGKIKDPITGKLVALPDYRIATAMIFKAYEKVSYALLMQASATVKIGDRASSP